MVRNGFHFERVLDFPMASLVLDERVGINHVWLSPRDLEIRGKGLTLIWIRGSNLYHSLSGFAAQAGCYGDPKIRRAVADNMSWVSMKLTEIGQPDPVFDDPTAWDTHLPRFPVDGNVLLGAILINLDEGREEARHLNEWTRENHRLGSCVKVVARVRFDQICGHDERWKTRNLVQQKVKYVCDLIRLGMIEEVETSKMMKRMFYMML